VNELYASIKKSANATAEPEMCPPRVGDIRDSLADISKAKTLMGYNPEVGIDEGIAITLDWFNHKFVQA
jgi:UDP-N-acetylglucosamine 4-epimerase